MGVRAGLTEIPSEIFEQISAGAEPAIPKEPHYSIDKAWNDFHQVFRNLGPPLDHAISGDRRHPQCLHTMDNFCGGDHEYFVGFASPELVQEVSNALASLTPADYKRIEVQFYGDGYNCGETFFSALKAAYENASAAENAVMIVIC